MIKEKTQILIRLLRKPNAKYIGIKKLYLITDKEWFRKQRRKSECFYIPRIYISKYEDELKTNK